MLPQIVVVEISLSLSVQFHRYHVFALHPDWVFGTKPRIGSVDMHYYAYLNGNNCDMLLELVNEFGLHGRINQLLWCLWGGGGSFTFAKELVYHIFYPMSVPLMWWLDGGWLSLVNRGFFSLTNPRLAFGQALLALCCKCLLAYNLLLLQCHLQLCI